MGYSWFRLYSEMLSDRKVARAARMAGCERATAVGVWVGMMCLASESSERGRLLLAPGVPFTGPDIAEEVGCAETTVAGLLDAFERLEMVTRDGDVLAIVHWNERQYESDKSTARVRRHRARKRSGNVPETLPERSGNAPDTDSDTDTESDQKQNHHPAPPHDDDDDKDDDCTPPPPPGDRDLLRERWQETVAGGRALTRADYDDLRTRVAAYGEPVLLEALERMRAQPRERWCRKYVDITLENMADESRPPPEPPPIDQPQDEGLETVAQVPWWSEFAARVRAAVPELVFETWLADAVPVDYSDSVLVLGVGGAMAKDWLENRLYGALQRAASEAAGRTVSVRFMARANRRAPPGVALGEACAVTEGT